MKRRYVSPKTELLMKYTCTICAGSSQKLIWNVDQTHDETSPDMGNINFDKGEDQYAEEEDPWNPDNW